jgi:hypothetical protein
MRYTEIRTSILHPETFKFDNGRIHQSSESEAIKKAYIPYSNEYKGTKNYGLGIRMINWPNGKTSIITMAGGMATWRPTLRYQKKR